MVMLKMAASSQESNKPCEYHGSKWRHVRTLTAEHSYTLMCDKSHRIFPPLLLTVLPHLSSYKFVNSYMLIFDAPLCHKMFIGSIEVIFFCKY